MGPDVDTAILEEMRLYKKFGGGTIVENTSLGLKRNIPLMVQVSKATGVNVVAGTGKHVKPQISYLKILICHISCLNIKFKT